MATVLYKMPDKGLSGPEREALRHSILTPKEREDLEKVGSFQVAAMQEAQSIVVALPIPKGYLGDCIQASRVSAVIAAQYPDKTFLNTEAPKLFGKYPLVEDPRIRTGSMRLQQIDQNGKPVRVSHPDSAFFPNSEIYNLNSGVLWRANGLNERTLSKGSKELDSDRVEEVHQYHMMQALWEVMYGHQGDVLSSPAIRVDEASQKKAVEIYTELPISRNLNVIMHPDSSSIKMDMLFYAKKWKTKKWVELIRGLAHEHSNISLFLSVGADHPDVSGAIAKMTKDEDLPLTVLPRVPLAQYVALIDNFPKQQTVFVGLESMPAGHLAPNLGLKSVVLSDAQLYSRHYGPFGGYVVANDDLSDNEFTSRVSVEGVIEAIQKSIVV